MQMILFFKIHKTMYKKEYQVVLNKGFLCLNITACLIELEAAQACVCVS